MTLTEVGIVLERPLKVRGNKQDGYTVCFSRVEIKDGGCFRSLSGDGATMTEAKRGLCEAIPNEILVIDAWSIDRKEIQMPPKITIR